MELLPRFYRFFIVFTCFYITYETFIALIIAILCQNKPFKFNFRDLLY